MMIFLFAMLVKTLTVFSSTVSLDNIELHLSAAFETASGLVFVWSISCGMALFQKFSFFEKLKGFSNFLFCASL